MSGTHANAVTLIVFALTLIATFIAAWLGRRHGGGDHGGLAEQKLNRWLIGLSAGAAANSGFVVTGAVGLGYTGGLTFILLPLGWLIGDILFWTIFPSRINAFGQRSKATTLSELITHGLKGPVAITLSAIAALLVTVCLSGYVGAQWIAGEKFLAGAFGVPDWTALALFALLIVSYTAIGGFRGSVYVDSLQAVIRLIGTAIALGFIAWVVMRDPESIARLTDAGPGFLSILGTGGIGAAVGVLAGLAAASLGFGLGQPHLVSRYLAGASPSETQSAWWIYIGFVQFTWIAMTLFGVLLRGAMPGLEDPEAGLSVFFEANAPAILTGIIVADVFATIAATSNALLVAIAQSLAHDVMPRLFGREKAFPLAPICVLAGAVTMAFALMVDASVVTLALGSVSLLGAGLAPAVLVRVLGWRATGTSLIASVLVGVGAAIAWRVAGLDGALNEAAPGIAAGLLTNALVAALTPSATPSPRD